MLRKLSFLLSAFALIAVSSANAGGTRKVAQDDENMEMPAGALGMPALPPAHPGPVMGMPILQTHRLMCVTTPNNNGGTTTIVVPLNEAPGGTIVGTVESQGGMAHFVTQPMPHDFKYTNPSPHAFLYVSKKAGITLYVSGASNVVNSLKTGHLTMSEKVNGKTIYSTSAVTCNIVAVN